ncbi:MAG: transposase [Planctomycetes bacterium]|nr:transposase [Planctomycetota bacterium]
MSHTYYKIWTHIIWSTKNRQPILNDGIRGRILTHIREKAAEEHHKKISFVEEFNKLLKLYNIILPSGKDETA